MNFKDTVGHYKNQHFKGLTLKERHAMFLSVIKAMREVKSDISVEEIELLKHMVRDDSLSECEEIVNFYDQLVELWCRELFNVVVTSAPAVKESNEESDEEGSYYDPYILSLHDKHPDKWSTEDLREDMQKNMKGYFEDEQQ